MYVFSRVCIDLAIEALVAAHSDRSIKKLWPILRKVMAEATVVLAGRRSDPLGKSQACSSVGYAGCFLSRWGGLPRPKRAERGDPLEAQRLDRGSFPAAASPSCSYQAERS